VKQSPEQASSQRIRQRWQPAILLLLAALSGLSGYVGIDLARYHNMEIAIEGARNIFRMVALTRQWNADHGGVYVLVDPQTQPNPYLQHAQRDIQDQFGRKLTLMNPAFMTREIAELAERSGHLRLHLTSLDPIRPANQADDWEASALRSFEQGKPEIHGVEQLDEHKALRYMAPLMVSPGCLPCHAQQGYRVGDIRGGISVSMDYRPIEQNMQRDIQAVIGTHVLFFMFTSGLSVFLLEILRRRWMRLDETIATLESTRDELVNSEKMASLGRLVAGFAHEINTPMGVAVSAVSHGQASLETLEKLLQQEEVNEQDLHPPLEALRESQRLALANLRRGADLVQRFKRTSIDQVSAEKRRFSLHEAIHDVLSSLHNKLKHLPIQIDVHCPPELTLYGTPGLIEQLLTNLIMNSILHGFAGGTRSGTIVIDARDMAEHTRLELRFSDNGAGIAPEVLKRLFEPFMSTRRSEGGSGLGLFIVYNIVTQDLGGNIHCDSTPEQGTRFMIEFPLQQTSEA
jgi:two-component system NtrC family sensor kinase